MDFSQDLLIDWGLTAGGYIAAGLLAAVMYSMFRDVLNGRRVAAGPVPKFAEEPEVRERISRPKITLTRGPEEAAPKPQQENHTLSTYNRNLLAQEGYRRNRTGAIRVARELIRAGASSEQIKAVLPISEAELNMLRQETN